MKWKSRKFISWAIITALIFVCLFNNNITEQTFQVLIMFIVPIYFGANVIDKKINNNKE